MRVPGKAVGTLTVPVIPAPSQSFALWLRCNHGSFGRLWKWSKQAEMDGEISSVQCPESAGCAVHLIAPSYTDHIASVCSGQWGMANLTTPQSEVAGLENENVSELQFSQTVILWCKSAQVRHDHNGQMLGQQANWKKKKDLYHCLLKEICCDLFSL